ncbi:MAG: aldose 1-epimerase [Pseudomonadota bacterium]|nr:aldose 1-epimerase [Pseudomonadota bacterium]
MTETDLLILRHGALELALSPTVGGAVAGLHWIAEGRVPIMRESPDPLADVLGAASFPLVPYVNRIRGGEFAFRGRTVRIAPNMAGDPSPLHGQGWLAPWRVESAGEAEAVLSFRHAAGEWPWDYEARQYFQLDEGGVSLGLTCRNLSDDPMPCGLGQHPYFPCGPRTRIATSVDHVWTIDEDVLPVDKVPASGRFDLTDRLACGQDLDHGFGGWGGSAILSDREWPFEVAMSSPTARFFQLYSPAKGGIFVAEPVTHANAALNAPEAEWPELGMQVLDPGEEMRLDMRIDVWAVERRG